MRVPMREIAQADTPASFGGRARAGCRPLSFQDVGASRDQHQHAGEHEQRWDQQRRADAVLVVQQPRDADADQRDRSDVSSTRLMLRHRQFCCPHFDGTRGMRGERECSSMAEQKLPKPTTRARFPSVKSPRCWKFESGMQG